MYKIKNIFDFITEQMINEIGDASSKAYDWKWDSFSKSSYKTNGELVANFKTDSVQYEVKIEPDHGNKKIAHVVGFGVVSGYHDVDYEVETNKGDMFAVLSTVIDIVKKGVKMLNTEELIIVPSKAGKNDSRRLRLYMAYIKKQIPGASVKVDKHEIKTFKGKTKGTEEVIVVTF